MSDPLVSLPVTAPEQAPTPAGGSCCGSSSLPSAAETPCCADTPPAAAPSEGELLDALRKVIDPELMINVVDLGLVYAIVLEGDREGRDDADQPGVSCRSSDRAAVEAVSGTGAGNQCGRDQAGAESPLDSRPDARRRWRTEWGPAGRADVLRAGRTNTASRASARVRSRSR